MAGSQQSNSSSQIIEMNPTKQNEHNTRIGSKDAKHMTFAGVRDQLQVILLRKR